MSDWHLQAYHDPRAEPVADMWLQSSSQIPEYLPQLVEKAGLGKEITGKPFTGGKFYFENGEIHAKKHYYNQGSWK